NERSRISEMTGHDQPKRPVTMLRNPQEPFLWERRVHALLSDKRLSSSREFFYGPLIDIINTIEGDGECLSYWDSDQATEARNPGMVWPGKPLWFEQNLHSAGYLERLRRNAQ
ncbi:GIY-YIG nuclease family protein, partial [Pseudomonas aeruginosa]|uniref:GIY-YIG nuclease family protein n=1 Tax=Pseudomonas aeruginosa TaxID=287 RepID=UPI00402B874E